MGLSDFQRLVVASILGGVAFALFRYALEHVHGGKIDPLR